VKQAHSM